VEIFVRKNPIPCKKSKIIAEIKEKISEEQKIALE